MMSQHECYFDITKLSGATFKFYNFKKGTAYLLSLFNFDSYAAFEELLWEEFGSVSLPKVALNTL